MTTPAFPDTRMPTLPHSVAALTLTAILANSGLGQSPWTREDGGGLFQLAAYSVSYDRLYRSSGPDFRTSRKITDTTLEAYGEFGFTEDWTLIGRVPLKLLDAGDPVSNPTLPLTTQSGSVTALGNLEFGVRRKLIDDAVTISGQFDVEFPTGQFDAATGLSSGYDAFTFTPTLSIGRSLDRSYLFGYAGLGLRTNDFSSIWNVGVEGGVRVVGDFWLVGNFDLVQSFENGNVSLPPSNLESGLYLNDQEWAAYGLKGRLGLSDNLGLQASVASAFAGNNVPKALLFGLSMYFEW